MLLAITASWACGVPGIDASTRPAGLCSGIFAKSGGSWPPGAYSHGPSVERARNHRPEMRTYVSCGFNSRDRCALGLVGVRSWVPVIGLHVGGPLVSMSSVGTVLTYTTLGVGWPAGVSSTSIGPAFSTATRAACREAGGAAAGAHEASSAAASRYRPPS